MPTLTYKFQDQEHCFDLAGRTTIGREKDNDLCVPCPSISPHHAIILREGEVYQLVDREKSGGIFVEKRKASFLILHDRSKFSLGEVDFVFSAANGVGKPVEQAASEPEPEVLPLAQEEPPPAPSAQEETPPQPSAQVESLPLTEPQPEAQPESQPDIAPDADIAPADIEVSPLPVAAEPVNAKMPLPEGATPEQVIARFKIARDTVLAEVGKVIIGQRDTLNQMLVALFARGHCLLIGVPGLAKTLMVKTLGSSVDLQSNRIQFTPDLMPSDITGTDILEEDSVTGRRNFRFHRGPLFANLLLADEINRTPPKTQAALLEAMQEHRVTVSGASYDLPEPFMVLATQNPIEQEGTYPLPEAQLDRFMFCIHLSYPSAAEEQQVILDTTRETPAAVNRVLNAAEVLELQRLVRHVPVSQHVALYALSLIRATRPNNEDTLEFVNRWVRWGAGTRAGQYLLLAAKAHVLLEGRFSVSCADVREYALPVLRHRIFPNFTAASEGVNTDQIVKKIVESVKEPKY